MRICPTCRQPPADPVLVACPTHHQPFVEEENLILSPTEVDLDRIAARVAKTFRQEEDFDRIAVKVFSSFKSDDWKLLANQVMKSLHAHDVEIIAKAIMGTLVFWIIFVMVLVVLGWLLYEVAGHAAKEQARTLFRSEVTNQIKLQFEDTRISNIVAWAASSQASNLLKHAVSPEIAKFSSAVEKWERELETEFRNVKRQETDLMERIEELRKAKDRVQAGLRRLQRAIPAEKTDDLVKTLSTLVKCRITIFLKGDTPEATVFVEELAELFKRSGFEYRVIFESIQTIPMPAGERLHVSNLKNPPACAVTIQQSLNSFGLNFQLEQNPSLSTNEIHLYIWNKAAY